MNLGHLYSIPPEPPAEANTQWFAAGSLRIGVEYRDVDPESLIATYAANAEHLAALLAESPEEGFTDDGVSLHVVDADAGDELLRFDAFDHEPHYHYIHRGPEIVNQVVPYDRAASGDMLAWAFQALRARIRDMLAVAGAGDLAALIDDDEWASALTAAEQLAHEAERSRREPGMAGGEQ